MEIQSTDKLLIGRDGQSYQTDFENSGIPTKDNLDEHLHKVVGGTITGTVEQHAPVRFSGDGSVFFDDNTIINVYQNRKITFQTGGTNRLEIGQQGINFLKGKPITFKGGDSNSNILYIDTVAGGAAYTGEIAGDNNLVNKKYVDDSIPEVPDVSGFATTEYVDQEIANIGDVLVFKGTLDFTADEAPVDAATGHVYSNSGTGVALSSWGVGDVTPGELYGFGETQWGIIGAGEVDLSNAIPLSGTESGHPVTGDIVLATDVNISFAGEGAGLDVQAGHWGGLFYDGSFQMEFGRSGLKAGTDINMKGGHTNFNESQAEQQYNNVGGGWDPTLHGHGIHWLKAPEHKYDATNKEYVDGYAMPKNLNTLPALG